MTDSTEDSMEDLPQGTEALSSSPGPGDLAALAEHPLEGDEEPLDEFPVPSEDQPSGVTGLVVGDPDANV
jgi:hypothetical protein